MGKEKEVDKIDLFDFLYRRILIIEATLNVLSGRILEIYSKELGGDFSKEKEKFIAETEVALSYCHVLSSAMHGVHPGPDERDILNKSQG